MKTIYIDQAFTGYPGGAKEGSKHVNYREGDVVEVNNDFAAMVIEKGLAHEASATEARSAQADGDEETADKPSGARSPRRGAKTSGDTDDGSERTQE